ncbi:MAG TPA: PAS domain S-box protein, partial [Chitinivibrionales bacterium]|nr:PAS domain S-box protein [Chitinivibrionales bacterium]
IGQIPMNRVCAGETFFGQEYSVYVHPTKRRWCASFSGAPVLDNAGKIEYAVLTIRDISERKQAEWSAQAAYELTQHKLNEVAEYKNRLEAVMHTLPVGVAVLDTQGGTVLANLAFDTIWGNPKPAATNIGDYIQDKAEWADTGKTILPDEWASSRALRSGETVVGQIIRITGFDGVQRVVLNSAAPVLDTKGEVAGCAVAVQNISEHMVLEKALRQSEERYRHLVQYAPAGIYDVDFATGRFTEVNDVMCRVLGYTRDELLSMTAFEILDDQSKALFASRIRKAQARERLDESFEYRVKVKDGRVIWAILNVTFRWEDKRIVGATVVAHDITERKQMEEKLQTTLQRFYLILSNMHFGILLVTNENRVEFVNQSFCDMFGLRDRPDDLTKLSADEMIDTIRPCYTKPDEAIARIRELVLLGQTVSGEDVGMSRGRSLLRDFIPIRIGEKLYGRLWVHADITERKRAEEELRESETKLRAIFETSVDAIGVVKAGIHVSANPAYLALFGYSDNVGLIGKSITGLIAPSQRPVIAENVHLRARGDSAPSSYETRGLRKDGTEFDMDVRVSAYAVDGEVASVVILRDITDRKKAEEEIARHLEELRVSNEELARFNRVAVDRELRMIELKKQVNELCGKAGMEPRYKVEVGE